MNDQNAGRKLGGRSGIFGNNQAPPIFSADTADSQTQGLVLDLISEGPILGMADVLYGGNGAKSIFLNNTPLQREDGGYNFGQTIDSFGNVHPSKMAWAFRNGTATQDWMRGFSSVESEQAGAGKVVKTNTSTAGGTIDPVQHISDDNMDAVVVTMRIPALSVTDAQGNILQFTVGWNVSYQDLSYSGGFVNFSGASGVGNGNYHVSGKSSSGIDTQCYQLLKPPGYVPGPNLTGGAHPGWNIKVRRLTQDLDSDLHYQASTVWYSTTRVLEQKLSYPFSALVGIEAPSAAFGGQMPTRNYDVFGRIVQVPTNYTPTQYAQDDTITPATYVGLWDGTFKLEWTDNPVWCVLDMLTNSRYGLNVPISQIDIGSLYVISQYCDQMIADGQSGLHPRYTLNIQITTQQEAYNIINQLCATMMTMVYYTAGLITFAQDSPREPDMVVTSANVIDGQFNYAGQTYENTPNIIVTRYLNPAMNYQPDTAIVQNTADIAKRSQAVPLSLDAFGIDDPGRATRIGRWALYTNIYEGEVLTYQAGLDHADIMPGMILSIQDPLKVGTPNIGGRVLSSVDLENQLKQSNGFTTSPWGVSGGGGGSSQTPNATLGPDGLMSGWAINSGVASVAALSQITGTITGEAQTLSIYTKHNTSTLFSFDFRDQTLLASVCSVIFTWTAGVPVPFIGAGVGSITVTPLPNGWYRVSITATGVAGHTFRVLLFPESASGPSCTGAGNYFFGIQLNNGTSATPYINTTTSVVSGVKSVNLDRSVQLIALHTYTLNLLLPDKSVVSLPVLTGAGTTNVLSLNGIPDTTNFLYSPNDFLAPGSWTLSFVNQTLNAATASDGSVSATKFFENNTGVRSFYAIQTITTLVAVQKYQYQYEFKAAERTRVRMLISDGTAVDSAYAVFDLVGARVAIGPILGGASPFTAVSASVVQLAAGWVRCTLNFTSNGTVANLNAQVGIDGGTGLGPISTTYPGVIGNGIYVGVGSVNEVSPLPSLTNAIWSIQDNALTALWWRVLSKRVITRSTFEITATHRYPNKFNLIESDLVIEGQAYNVSTNFLPAPLQSSFKVTEYLTLNQSGVVSPRLLVGWGVGGSSTSTLADALPTDARITNYTVQMRLSSLPPNVFDEGINTNTWTTLGKTRSPSIDIIDLAPGTYDFQVRAETDFGLFSDWTILTSQSIVSINLAPADVTGMGINVLGDNATLSWNQVTSFNLSYYEVRYSPDTSGTAIWDTAAVLQTGIRTLSIQIPNLPGTYFVKGVNLGGVYSVNATVASGGAIISGVTGLTIVNTLHSIQEELATAATVTISIATPAVITWANHNLQIGTPVKFTGGTLPTGIVSGTTYFVIAAGYLAGSFEISATLNGAAINTSGTQSGTHTGTIVAWHGDKTNGLTVSAGSLLFTPPSLAATISIANPGVITWTAHNLVVGTPVAFAAGADVLPSHFVAGTIYYIAVVLGVNTFTLATTPGGVEISTVGDTQSGTHTLTAYGAVYAGDQTQAGSSVINLGALLQCRVSPILISAAQLTGNVMASWTSLALLANMTGVASNQWSALYQMRFSDVDPTSPSWHGVAGWSPWMPAVTGDFKFWAMETQLMLAVVNTATLTITTTAMDLNIVVPDRVIAANNVSIPAASTAITFLGTTGIRPFFHLDGITITIQNPSTGDFYNITAMSETGFTIELRTAGNVLKTGVINFVAKGYGSA